MSKKINENELNNVSGGSKCNEDKYYVAYVAYESPTKIRVKTTTDYRTTLELAKEDLKEMIVYVFGWYHKKVQHIHWQLKHGDTVLEEGDAYRND